LLAWFGLVCGWFAVGLWCGTAVGLVLTIVPFSSLLFASEIVPK
jgi:hypothetical protein